MPDNDRAGWWIEFEPLSRQPLQPTLNLPGQNAQLDLTVKSGVTTCTNAGFDADGTVIYGPGDLGAGLIGGMNIIGNPAQGAHPGDRTLAAGAKEDLCFNVELPSSTNNTYQGLSATATFNFQAEQTKNNP